ncbi:MAG: hypothetical protein ACRD1E_08050 [Terriglobales bacterium]
MYFPRIAVSAMLLGASLGLAQAAAPALPPGTQFKVELQKKLDSKKSKVGDKVIAKLEQDVKVDGKTILPKNSLLEGEVTIVGPAEGNGPGKLGVLFNEAADKKGQALFPLRAAIIKVVNDAYNNATAAFSRPAEMGGSGSALPMDAGNSAYAKLDRSSNGIPIEYSLMETFNGDGKDLGGVVFSVGSNFNLDDGTYLEIQVLH